jgi:phenylalanyl-tRNA synthetase alpha chain
MKNKIEQIKEDVLNALKKIKSSEALEELELKYMSRKGEFSALMKNISNLDPAEKKEIGMSLNNAKKELLKSFGLIKKTLGKEKTNSQFVDMTLPGEKKERGSMHPITLIQNEIEDLFSSMGFMVLDGPELESDFYNFEALNIPEDHPARDMQDTFYVNKSRDNKKTNLVMRTHTSPMQVRAMQKYGAPLRCVVPGRVFRAEATDAVHEHTFDQIEGLMIGEGISLSNLIAVMKELINGIFKREVEVRIRPGYFPFVEPGIELDIKCTICHGAKCSACTHTGWLELLPAGMVHPNVLRAGGIDPEKYSGFAFGLGLTRMAMMRYEVNDIRLFNSGDLRFLKQF